MDFGSTMVKTTIHSHDDQKDQLKIFGCGAAKMGEIIRWDTLETTGVIFRSKILSPRQTFGNLTHFVAPQNAIRGSGHTLEKRPNRNFRAWGGKNGWNFREGYFRDQWRHVPEKNYLFRAKIWKSDPFRCTSKCDPRFLSHTGQKDRFEIFGHGEAKMGEICRRISLETFWTSAFKFQRNILSPEEDFGNLTHLTSP